MRTVLTFLVTVVVLVGFACGDDDSDDQSAGATTPAQQTTGESLTVGFVSLSRQLPFFLELEEGLKARAQEYGWELSVTDADFDPVKATDQIDNFITQQVDAIIVSPGDPESLIPAYERARDAGIPVISATQGLAAGNEELEAFVVTVDWATIGAQKADKIVEAIGGEGKVIALHAQPGSPFTEDQKAAMREVFEGQEGIDLAFEQESVTPTVDEGLRLATDALTANSDAVAIWAANDELALGAAQAVEEAGISHDEIYIVGTNGIDTAVEQIRQGNGIDYTIRLKSYTWGLQIGELTNDFLTKNESPSEHVIEAEIQELDSENVNDFTAEELR